MATRLYLRDTPSYDCPPPGKLSTALPNAATTDGNYWSPFEDRALSLIKGETLPESTITRSSIADATNHVDQYIARFTSRKLAAQTIAANTWTAALALSEANVDANSTLCLSVYVYRPSTRAVVGYVYDSHTALGVEWSTVLDGQVVTFSGAAVTCLAGDVLCMEVWRHTTVQTTAVAFAQVLYFSGYVVVTDTTTADPASYLETPGNLTWAPAELPSIISGVFVETMGTPGPFQNAAGDLYVVAEDTELSPAPTWRKSTDGGKTWTTPDYANRPTGSNWDDLECYSVVKSGTVLRSLRQRSGASANNLVLLEFDMNTELYGLKEAVTATQTGSLTQQGCSLVERTNGDLYAFYQEYSSATLIRTVYKKKPSGGAWGAAVLVRGAAGTGTAQVNAVRGASDVIHIFMKEDTSTAYGGTTDQVVYRNLNTSDVLSTEAIVNDTTVNSIASAMVSPALYIDNGGVEWVYNAWAKPDGRLAGAWVISGGTPEPEEIITPSPVMVDPADTAQFQPVAGLAIDPVTKHMYCAFSDSPLAHKTVQPDIDECNLWLVKRDWTTGWGTPKLLLDRVRIQILYCNIVTHAAGNGGHKVLGMFYDDANGCGYHEEILDIAPNGAAYAPVAMRAR